MATLPSRSTDTFMANARGAPIRELSAFGQTLSTEFSVDLSAFWQPIGQLYFHGIGLCMSRRIEVFEMIFT
jgi:hypothetical protein